MSADQDYPLGGDELPRWRAMCDEIDQLRAERLGREYLAKVTAPRVLTPEDEAKVHDLLRSPKVRQCGSKRVHEAHQWAQLSDSDPAYDVNKWCPGVPK